MPPKRQGGGRRGRSGGRKESNLTENAESVDVADSEFLAAGANKPAGCDDNIEHSALNPTTESEPTEINSAVIGLEASCSLGVSEQVSHPIDTFDCVTAETAVAEPEPVKQKRRIKKKILPDMVTPQSRPSVQKQSGRKNSKKNLTASEKATDQVTAAAPCVDESVGRSVESVKQRKQTGRKKVNKSVFEQDAENVSLAVGEIEPLTLADQVECLEQKQSGRKKSMRNLTLSEQATESISHADDVEQPVALADPVESLEPKQSGRKKLKKNLTVSEQASENISVADDVNQPLALADPVECLEPKQPGRKKLKKNLTASEQATENISLAEDVDQPIAVADPVECLEPRQSGRKKLKKNLTVSEQATETESISAAFGLSEPSADSVEFVEPKTCGRKKFKKTLAVSEQVTEEISAAALDEPLAPLTDSAEHSEQELFISNEMDNELSALEKKPKSRPARKRKSTHFTVAKRKLKKKMLESETDVLPQAQELVDEKASEHSDLPETEQLGDQADFEPIKQGCELISMTEPAAAKDPGTSENSDQDASVEEGSVKRKRTTAGRKKCKKQKVDEEAADESEATAAETWTVIPCSGDDSKHVFRIHRQPIQLVPADTASGSVELNESLPVTDDRESAGKDSSRQLQDMSSAADDLEPISDNFADCSAADLPDPCDFEVPLGDEKVPSVIAVDALLTPPPGSSEKRLSSDIFVRLDRSKAVDELAVVGASPSKSPIISTRHCGSPIIAMRGASPAVADVQGVVVSTVQPNTGSPEVARRPEGVKRQRGIRQRANNEKAMAVSSATEKRVTRSRRGNSTAESVAVSEPTSVTDSSAVASNADVDIPDRAEPDIPADSQHSHSVSQVSSEKSDPNVQSGCLKSEETPTVRSPSVSRLVSEHSASSLRSDDAGTGRSSVWERFASPNKQSPRKVNIQSSFPSVEGEAEVKENEQPSSSNAAGRVTSLPPAGSDNSSQSSPIPASDAGKLVVALRHESETTADEVPLKKRRIRVFDMNAASDSDSAVAVETVCIKTEDQSQLSNTNPAAANSLAENSPVKREVVIPMELSLPVPRGNKYVGAHTSVTGNVVHAVLTANQLGSRAFGMFVKCQSMFVPPVLDNKEAAEFRHTLKMKGYSPHLIVPHGSYLLNCGSADQTVYENSRESLVDDLRRCRALALPMFNFHPGSYQNQGTADDCINRVADAINYAHSQVNGVITVIENMPGQPGTIGGQFLDLRRIINRVRDKSRVAVCLDICHAFAAGFDLRTATGYEKMMSDFDRAIGLKYLKAIHANDSQDDCGSRRDHHASIGKGRIGLECFRCMMNDRRLDNLPIVLETPAGTHRADIELLYSLVN